MTAWHRWDGADLLLRLRVQPRASRDELRLEGDRLRVRITAPPVDGAANRHLLRFLAAEFGVAPSRATLLRGTSGREKEVRIAAPARIPSSIADSLHDRH
ncbi:MAG: YggU family protein [Proteobacteria bacterium]|nr:YggU family protein [Pseudomonadota bacterium]